MAKTAKKKVATDLASVVTSVIADSSLVDDGEPTIDSIMEATNTVPADFSGLLEEINQRLLVLGGVGTMPGRSHGRIVLIAECWAVAHVTAELEKNGFDPVVYAKAVRKLLSE